MVPLPSGAWTWADWEKQRVGDSQQRSTCAAGVLQPDGQAAHVIPQLQGLTDIGQGQTLL